MVRKLDKFDLISIREGEAIKGSNFNKAKGKKNRKNKNNKDTAETKITNKVVKRIEGN